LLSPVQAFIKKATYVLLNTTVLRLNTLFSE
jgi:hypothetical protein